MAFNFTDEENQRFSSLLELHDKYRYSRLIDHPCSLALLDAVVWLRENASPRDEWVITRTAEGDHLEVAKRDKENGCSWDEEAITWAARRGQLEIMKWLGENGYHLGIKIQLPCETKGRCLRLSSGLDKVVAL